MLQLNYPLVSRENLAKIQDIEPAAAVAKDILYEGDVARVQRWIVQEFGVAVVLPNEAPPHASIWALAPPEDLAALEVRKFVLTASAPLLPPPAIMQALWATINGLAKTRAALLPMPGTVAIHPDFFVMRADGPQEFMLDAASYLPDDGGVIHLNPGAMVFGTPAYRTKILPTFQKHQQTVSERLSDEVVHEVGHFVHLGINEAGGAKAEAINAQPWQGTERETIARTLSRAASYRATEFVAEAFTVKLNGHTLDAPVQALYEALDGPKV